MTGTEQQELHQSRLLYDSANAQLGARNFDAAIASYRECLAAEPAFAPAYNNLGSALLETGRFEEALEVLATGARLAPGYVRPLVNLGKALRELGRHEEAVAILERALAIEPNYVPALINLGDVLIARDELGRAHEVLSAALARSPDQAMALASLGICELRLGRKQNAVARLRRARTLAPGDFKISMSLAHASFACGDWAGGWAQLRSHPRALHSALRPGRRWDGRSRPCALELIAEQGLGDTIHFARYGRELRQQGIGATLVVPQVLVALMRSSGLFDAVVEAPTDTTVHEPIAEWFPLMSLPEAFCTTAETVPYAGGYLQAEPRRVAEWASHLSNAKGLRVGIVWQGNPQAERGMLLGRSPGLLPFAPLARRSDITLFCLQKGPGLEQLGRVDFGSRIKLLPHLDDGPGAFMDSVAVIANLDLVITSDTSVAHLAGGLGRPVWICLQKYPDWRWEPEGSTTPWYTSARLFRQKRNGVWGEVFEQVARALDGVIQDRA